MPHVRQQARDAIITAIAGMASVSDAKEYAYKPPGANLPFVAVKSGAQELQEFYTIGYPRQIEYLFSIELDVYLMDAASNETALDAFLVELQTVINTAYSGGRWFGVLRDCAIESVREVNQENEGERPVADVTVSLRTIYRISESSASVAT